MVRPAAAADVPELLRLIRELAAYEKLSHEVVATEPLLQDALFGADPSAEALVAEDAGRLVGFALFFRSFSTFLGRPGLYLEDLFVEPAARGRGHGRALFTAVGRLASQRGCGRYEWAVLDWNAPAIGFYRSFGARPMEDWTVFRLSGDSLRRLGTR